MKQTDQYGQNIPQDLTLLEWNDITSRHASTIDQQLDWYCFEGNKTNHIFVSQSELEKVLDGPIDNLSPDDCILNGNLVKIDSVLHRWTKEDGFYWV